MTWYDMIAKKNGGYKSSAKFAVKGLSGEDVFEHELSQLMKNSDLCVLDAGCGDGEFTLKMASFAKRAIGFDFSQEMISIADAIKQKADVENVEFVFADTNNRNIAPSLPFEEGQFDLIYTRRGPSSIIDHARLLCEGGVMFGIHSGAKDKILERLNSSGLCNITIREFTDAYMTFENEQEFAVWLTDYPENYIDYTLPKNRELLNEKLRENMRNGEISIQQYRFIWKGVRE